ncbi:MAG: hypothetical protein Q8R92_14525 [Deltaproteobacteria bacterium]|nr:hypothetical protein [Deltaproteobacteria bacterium]
MDRAPAYWDPIDPDLKIVNDFVAGGFLEVDGMEKLSFVALTVLLLNLPFGYWRAGSPKFSRSWFLAIHIPIPFVILLRITSGLGWQLVSFPVVVGAFFVGQLLGGQIRMWRMGN